MVSLDGRTEDRVVVWRNRFGLAVALADGAGGIPGGGRAADLAVGAAVANGHEGPAAALAAADAAVRGDPLAGETTLVVAMMGDRLRIASAGDSEAWIVGGADLTAGQHRKRRLGSDRCDPVSADAPAFGRLLVASDGLFGYARAPSIHAAAAIRDLEAAADALVTLVRLPSGDFMDDVALALVDL